MTRRGRKPLALQHVRQLDGSDHAKQRMTTLLKTLQCDYSVGDARAEMDLSESYFHALRHQWHTMTIEQSTDTMWLLSGQVDEGEPVREISIHSLPFCRSFAAKAPW